MTFTLVVLKDLDKEKKYGDEAVGFNFASTALITNTFESFINFIYHRIARPANEGSPKTAVKKPVVPR